MKLSFKNKQINNKLICACFFSSAIILFTFLFFTVVYSSIEDTHIMYILSGGYGTEPSELLHYNFGWHPILGIVLKSLYSDFPEHNWYTILLVLIEWVGISSIVYVALCYFRIREVVIIILILYSLVLSRMIIGLNMSSACWVLSISSVFMIHSFLFTNKSWAHYIIPVISLMAAGLLRLHIAFLVLILSFPSLFYYKRFWVKSLILSCSFFISFFCIKITQEQYYSTHIKGWKSQEAIRQSFIYVFNRPKRRIDDTMAIFRNRLEMLSYNQRFLSDASAVFDIKRLTEIGGQLTRVRNFGYKVDWLIYFSQVNKWKLHLLFCVFMIGAIPRIKRREFLFNWLPFLFPLLCFYAYLIHFIKLKEHIELGVLCLALLSALYSLYISGVKFRFPQFTYIKLAVPLFLIFIGLSHLNTGNRNGVNRFKCASKEIISHPDLLFYDMHNDVPFEFFPVEYTHIDFPFYNLIGQTAMIFYRYPSLDRFKNRDLFDALVNNSKVRIIGEGASELKEYCQIRSGEKFILSSARESFNCIHATSLQKTTISH